MPPNTVELAIIVNDADVPNQYQATSDFTHWVIYNIPATLNYLPGNIGSGSSVGLTIPGITGTTTVSQGINDFSNNQYDGPAPPSGQGPHRYVFTIYALSEELTLSPSTTTKSSLLTDIENKTLSTGTFTGIFETP